MDSGPVPGHSLFTGCLIEGLSGRLAEGGRCIATGTELGLYVQKRVTAYSLSTQTPDFGPFELDDRGELVVPVLRDDTAATGSEPGPEPPLDPETASARSDMWTAPLHLPQRPANPGPPDTMAPELRPQATLKGLAPASLPTRRPPERVPALPPEAALTDDAATSPLREGGTPRAPPPAAGAGCAGPPCRPARRMRTVELIAMVVVIGIGAALGYWTVGPLIR